MRKLLADLFRRLAPKRAPTLRELAEAYSPATDAARRLALANGEDSRVYDSQGRLINGSPEDVALRAGSFTVTHAEVKEFLKAAEVRHSERVERHRTRDPRTDEVRWREEVVPAASVPRRMIYDRDRAARQVMREKLIAAVRAPHVNDSQKDEALVALIDLHFPNGGYETRQQAV